MLPHHLEEGQFECPETSVPTLKGNPLGTLTEVDVTTAGVGARSGPPNPPSSLTRYRRDGAPPTRRCFLAVSLLGGFFALGGIRTLTVPVEPVVVDMLELNRCSSQPDRGFYQLIAWRWEPDYSRFRVVAWQIFEMDEDDYPRRIGRKVFCLWGDKWVCSEVFKITKTRLDPEVLNRKWFPTELREGI